MQRERRLTRRNDFKTVYRRGRSVANREFVLYVLPNSKTDHFRLGVSASKKVGNAVVRNTVRRRVKEAIRKHAPLIRPGADLIVIARNASVHMNQSEVERSTLHLLRKSGLLVKNREMSMEQT